MGKWKEGRRRDFRLAPPTLPSPYHAVADFGKFLAHRDKVSGLHRLAQCRAGIRKRYGMSFENVCFAADDRVADRRVQMLQNILKQLVETGGIGFVVNVDAALVGDELQAVPRQAIEGVEEFSARRIGTVPNQLQECIDPPDKKVRGNSDVVRVEKRECFLIVIHSLDQDGL